MPTLLDAEGNPIPRNEPIEIKITGPLGVTQHCFIKGVAEHAHQDWTRLAICIKALVQVDDDPDFILDLKEAMDHIFSRAAAREADDGG